MGVGRLSIEERSSLREVAATEIELSVGNDELGKEGSSDRFGDESSDELLPNELDRKDEDWQKASEMNKEFVRGEGSYRCEGGASRRCGRSTQRVSFARRGAGEANDF